MKNLLKRLYDLVIKLESMKGLILIIATIAFFKGIMPWWGWLITACIVVFTRSLEKLLRALIDKWNGAIK